MGPKMAGGRKEKLALKAAQLEAARREQEEKEEQQRLEEERQRELEAARQAKRRDEEREMFEKAVREEILQGTCDFFNELLDKDFERRLAARDGAEWARYLTCDRLPYPDLVPTMNTYLYLWHATEETARMANVFQKNETILSLLQLLQDYIVEPLDASQRKLNNWIEVRDKYRKELREKMDLACFYMIRDIEIFFNRVNYWESDFEKKSTNVELYMWAWKVKTVGSSISGPPPSRKCGSVFVKLPASFSKSLLILRVLHTTYDHYSDGSSTWNEPANPIDHDFYDETNMWHGIKVNLIRDNFKTLKEAEEVPCWFETPQEFMHLESKEDVSGTVSDTTEQQDGSEGKEEKPSLLSLLSSLDFKTEKQKTMEEEIQHQQEETIPLEETKQESEEDVEVDETKEDTNDPVSKRIYVGKFPAEGRPEYYRITSEGDIDVIKTTGDYNLELGDDDCTHDRKFLDWLDLSKPVSLDEDRYLLNTFFGHKQGRHTACRSLAELMRDVTPRTGGLAALNIPEETRNILCRMLGITIKPDKKKDIESDNEEKKVYKPLKQLLSEAQVRYLDAYKKGLKVVVGENELNLRKYMILGGVYYIDLIHQVPQPHRHKNGTMIQINYGDYNISKENFFFKYVPPLITEDEENEDEDGKPPVDDDIDKLIYVEIQVSEQAMWFETPAPYLWDEQRKVWTSDNIYDVRYNEEKQIVSFRIGKTCPIGIATFRFYNLPYQTWEIRPAADWKESKSIVLSLTASTAIAEYLIMADKVSLTSVQNATGGALDGILGTPFPPNQLIRIMRQAGLDLFPGWDGFLYVEGNSAKKKVLEEHVYLSMAMFAPAFQYSWSRWNLPGGSDKVVFQLRECLKTREVGPYSMMLATSQRALLVNCTEVSPQFSEEPASKEATFQPDLFNLLENTASDKAKKRAKKTGQDLVFTLYYMLLQTKILSFS